MGKSLGKMEHCKAIRREVESYRDCSVTFENRGKHGVAIVRVGPREFHQYVACTPSEWRAQKNDVAFTRRKLRELGAVPL